MFFCNNCRVDNNWPGLVPTSYGNCEVCKLRAPCFDVARKFLPDPPKIIKQRWSTNDIALLATQIAELVEQYDLKTEFDGNELALDFVFSLLDFNDVEHYDTDVMGN